MKTLTEVIAEFSAEDQAEIHKLTEALILETGLQLVREDLGLSQKQVAQKMGVSQPAIAAIEQRGNDLKVLTLKRYVEALGGRLSLQLEFPEGMKQFRI
ncbi:helix-turn-helix domain-containing protein [Cedecea sp. FDAARGOS_727]|uniref:helix-turn-helix domain-containing protein n=1 Tax=Cedecea sp. FDAARGOS_727 TaxID=2545798 RepID=UPI00143E3E7B|nr:helix-turn-helix transcriptional regulator [Cedecea sp. FDAARGOS_727]QIX97146.1 helix-turn-helix transcriptional regulator [Cedecea sp. FDAARGOS_727]